MVVSYWLLVVGDERVPSVVFTNNEQLRTINKSMLGKRLNKEQAFQKLRQYCGYQERSHDEVKQKLYGFGLYRQDVEETISKLIEENYLNEERFAIAFAGGKFRSKHWGKVKIEYELKQKKVSPYCIRIAMNEIDDSDYRKTLLKLARKKWSDLKGPGATDYVKSSKTTSFLLQRGFERNLIASAINSIKEEKE